MHKYWGKKPSRDLNALIEKYSNENDILFDPFAGYGVFCIEAYISNRKVILNDLNPIASFIQATVLERDVNLTKLNKEAEQIRKDVEGYIDSWFTIKVNGEKKIATTFLRNKSDGILKCKYKNNTKKNPEYEFTDKEKQIFSDFESKFEIKKWFPTKILFENSRITVKEGTEIKDVFTKRTLDCHACLFESINKHSTGNEKNLLLLAFTANLANCSRLVPPIKSRGDMAPGAWMTGFYTGETYLENNVIHYFENRLKKIVKGKEEYQAQFDNLFSSINDEKLGSRENYSELLENELPGFLVITSDVKTLSLPDESIDYIFTDPPYGDSVPYFEQSILWNSWHNFEVDYDNEIIISNSKQRTKNKMNYAKDIEGAMFEVFRVLKYEKYFSITFHSLSGLEWNALNNACLKAGFLLSDFQWLVQKTFTPRQLNRAKTVKGDVLITFKKVHDIPKLKIVSKNEVIKLIEDWICVFLSNSGKETNDVFLHLVKKVYHHRLIIEDINFFELLSNIANFEENKWSMK